MESMKQTLSSFPAPLRRAGFTLVEMLIAATIAILIFFVGFVMITGTVRARGETMSRIHATESARLFFQMLEKDLASAHPGGYGMKMGTAPVPGSNPYTLVLNETTATLTSDLIQFYTHNDLSVESPGAEAPDRHVFVRYYVNHTDHTLCREVHEDSTQQVQMEADFPPATTILRDPRALFEDVRQVLIDFQYWDDRDKSMKPLPGNPKLVYDGTQFLEGGTPRVPTHIVVTLVMYDPYAEARMKNDPTVIGPGGDLNLIYRAFSKTLPIPAGF
jgi:prepilin-type N-terminal cleavage/methylation domain-containing protein